MPQFGVHTLYTSKCKVKLDIHVCKKKFLSYCNGKGAIVK